MRVVAALPLAGGGDADVVALGELHAGVLGSLHLRPRKRSITGKTRPDSGRVFFGSTINLPRLSEPQIAQIGVGRKFQKPTVQEPVGLGDRRLRNGLSVPFLASPLSKNTGFLSPG